MTRRVVVTGLGLITPLGNDVASNWEALVAGRSGIGTITLFDTSAYEFPIAGEVRHFDPAGHVEAKLLRRIDRSTVFALAASHQALADAGIEMAKEDARRVGVVIGTGIGSAQLIVEQAAILAEAARLGVADRVRCLGPVPLERLLPLYRDYDVFVLPTLPGEGIPRVLLEAMTAGVPVVTTRVAGIPSLIKHEVNGLLVETPPAAAVAAAISRVVHDAGLRRRLIANGYETARGFTLEAQAARILSEVSARLPITLKQPAKVPAA